MENKIEKIILDPLVPFFVHDKWHEKIELFQITFNEKTFSYHYLKDFFHLSIHDANDGLNQILNYLQQQQQLVNHKQNEDFLKTLPPSLAFFARSIFYHQIPLQRPFLITNQELTHYSRLNYNSHQCKRLKIKMDQNGIGELFNDEKNYNFILEDKLQIVLDFNQSLKATEVHALRKLIDHHPIKDQILYLEDPVKLSDYNHLNKEELKIIGLDESLYAIAQHEKHLLEHIQWLVIKPSLYQMDFIQNMIATKKNISFSSSYESPSSYRGFIPLIENCHSRIHGLSTFNIYPKVMLTPYLEHLSEMGGDEILVL